MTGQRFERVLVVAESVEEHRDRQTSELITVAQRIGRDIVVLVLGTDAVSRARECSGQAQVSVVLHADDERFEPSIVQPWLDAVDTACSQIQPSVILFSASLAGRDIAPRLAVRIDAPIASDVVQVSIDDNGHLVYRRQVHGGRMVTDLTIAALRSVVTIRPGSMRDRPQAGGSAEVRRLNLPPRVDFGVTLLETRLAEKSQQGLATAARIVSGGRGLGNPENFKLIEDLAAALDAAVGASGAVVGAGWRPHSEQVGSTGTTVEPRLYLAVGISGAVQHLIGMSGADSIVAINRDPEAPIFQVASLGIVGDLFEIVPALIAELRKPQE
ncbi:MAG: electron transfer flavoprotein subunit alpha/FixB family protein [Thermomicrobiales bacterium]